MKKNLGLILLALWLMQCTREEIAVDPFVDPALSPYFERFREEGARRGVVVDFAEAPVSGYLGDIPGETTPGQCYHRSGEPGKLVIDQAYWETAADIRREFIVFHELGHCFLQRPHLDKAEPDGSCTSIMHSGLTGCRNAYSLTTRNAYLDELFGN